jgi:hypothetical protein
LFEWTLEHVISRLPDVDAVAQLREIVDNNVCCLAFEELSASAQGKFLVILRTSLPDAAARELPQTDHTPSALQQLGELVALADGL